LRHYRPSAGAVTAQDPSAAITVPAERIIQADPRARALVDGVMQSLSSARQSEVQAWEEELVPCEHTLTLEQFSTGNIHAAGAHIPVFAVPFRDLDRNMSPLLGFCRTRFGALLKMRPQGEPLVVPHLRCARLWTQAPWRRRREWSCSRTLRRERTSGLRQVGHYYA
jgi:hypothetical protein